MPQRPRLPSTHELLLLVTALAVEACGGQQPDFVPGAAIDAGRDGGTPDLPGAAPDATPVRFTAQPIGRTAPNWRVERAWTVSAPLGLRADDTPEFGAFHDLFGAPNHGYSAVADQAAHLLPHDGPYGDEVDRALARAGLASRRLFSAREYFAPRAVYFVVLLGPTPGAPRGLTPDGAGREMIPDEVFPIRYDGPILQDGRPYDANKPGFINAPPVAYRGAWEGHTHAFYVLAENHEYGVPGSPLEGVYEWGHTVLDASNRGYRVSISFEVRCQEGDGDLPGCSGAIDAGVTDGGTVDVRSADVSTAPVPGNPCVDDVGCGPGGRCITTVGAATFPGGYCVYQCDAPGAVCPDVGVCVPIDLRLPWIISCLRSCDAGCRPEYRCVPLPGGRGAFCVP